MVFPNPAARGLNEFLGNVHNRTGREVRQPVRPAAQDAAAKPAWPLHRHCDRVLHPRREIGYKTIVLGGHRPPLSSKIAGLQFSASCPTDPLPEAKIAGLQFPRFTRTLPCATAANGWARSSECQIGRAHV